MSAGVCRRCSNWSVIVHDGRCGACALWTGCLPGQLELPLPAIVAAAGEEE